MVQMPCSLYMRKPHSHRRAGPLGALGTRRSASSGASHPGEGPTRPIRTRRRFRIAFWIAKVLIAIVLVFAVAVGLLFLLTPSAGQATALVRAQARDRHIAYPGPPVPAYFAQALIATEDHRFNTDPGVDPLAMGRVVVSWITGREDQGGSTIDQQLAKNLYTGGHGGFTEDLEQLAMAVKLNQTYSRPQILRMYAEVAYYGHGYYGLDAASCGYFGRPPERLTLVQAAMLAGVVNAPTYDDPLVYPRQARTRLVHVIGRMAAVGYLTQAQETAALNAPLGLSAVRGCA
jgi:membrane peptidoglycan carboxypeptidase